MRRILLCSTALCGLLLGAPAALGGETGHQAAATAPAGQPTLLDGLGTLTFTITTASPEAQKFFDQGLRLTHAFNHPEALRSFRHAQALDPTCAMCAWGEAYVLGPNINAPMEAAAVKPAVDAVRRAEKLAAAATPREQALIAALAERYSDDSAADRAALDKAYAAAMGEVAQRFPDDADILSLQADAIMNVAPWNYWEADRQTLRADAAGLTETLERALAVDPDHPFAIHLYIHAVEASTTPERAEPYADRLAALMPGAGHIVHMPSHIYFRVGRYEDAIKANRAAAAADEKYLAGSHDRGMYGHSYYPHNVHFLLESARLAGDGATALEAAEKLPRTLSEEVVAAVPWVQLIKVAPYFAHAQFSAPDTTLKIADPGDALPYVKAMWHYARGIAHAAAGRPDQARAEADAIARLEDDADWSALAAGGIPAPELLQIARHVIAGRIAQAGDDSRAAAAEFQQAAALQDELPYLEPPFWYYPVHQSLGAALLQSGDAKGAEQAFRQALKSFPNNAWALYGLAQAQREQGDETAATDSERRFDTLWRGEQLALDQL